MAKPRSVAEAILNLDRVAKYILRQRLLVGIPAEKAERGDGPLNNAQLAYLHETGSPVSNLPARPFLVPGVERADALIPAEIERMFTKAADLAVLDGNVSAAKAAIDEGLNRIGLKAVATIQDGITAGLAPPLSERTVYARLHRKKNRRTGPNMTPLIDTGKLLASITYVIRN